VTNLRLHKIAFIAAFFCFLYRCTPNLRLIKYNPPKSSSTVSVSESKTETVVDTQTTTAETEAVDSLSSFDTSATVEINFSSAFDSTIDTTSFATVASDSSLELKWYPPHKIVKRRVRIALERNTSEASFSTSKKIFLKTSTKNIGITAQKFSVRCSKDGRFFFSGSKGVREISCPCTLLTSGTEDLIMFNQVLYRGNLVLLSEQKGTFSVINHIDVEQYLRGVVPLEIGKRPESLIEALKAQAVAARTYTYKRMLERKNAPFDMTATVQDQVYGGADPEYRESDLAIKMTEDLIMVYKDSLINAYYHSTCGGKTANIEDVWEKPYCSYLRSVSDLNSSGQPYCQISPRFHWQEKWTSAIFFDQIRNNLSKAFPEKVRQGSIKEISVKESFSCGRVKRCVFSGNNWTVDMGGDRLRFIIRRDTPDKSILRSANFKIVSLGSKEVLISGTGYGHGVGMCQMGAIGRAAANQSFEEILKAYYTGVVICAATEQG
jgi:stage II sporulation protein D